MKSKRQLQRFIEEHQVVWETQPITAIHDGRRIQVGFELELRAAHKGTRPDCPQCHDLFRGMKKVAESVFPRENRPSRYEIGPFDHAFHIDSSRASDPEVVLKIQILHLHDYFQPIDDCERRCLEEIEVSLRALGVQRGRWRRTRAE